MPRKPLTTEEFIRKAIGVHGDSYDYSLVVYTHSKAKVQIVCPHHGMFLQAPVEHLRGYGCYYCGMVRSGQKRTWSTEEFIQKVKAVHGDVYDYSLTNYTGSKCEIVILCPIHGKFKQISDNHISGRGCKYCSKEKLDKSKVLSKEEFIQRATEVHGDIYDYSLVKYITTKTKVKIICKEHGVFEQRPNDHISQSNKCPICVRNELSKKFSLTTEEFIRRAKEIHGDKYDYSLVDYINSQSKVKLICRAHGIFKQRPNGHLMGNGCPKCTSQISKPELELQGYISSIYDGVIVTNSKKIISPYELDIYLPDINLAIEFNGEYWHSSEDAKRRDKETKRLCKEEGIKLMVVWERHWNNDSERLKLAILKTIQNLNFNY